MSELPQIPKQETQMPPQQVPELDVAAETRLTGQERFNRIKEGLGRIAARSMRRDGESPSSETEPTEGASEWAVAPDGYEESGRTDVEHPVSTEDESETATAESTVEDSLTGQELFKKVAFRLGKIAVKHVIKKSLKSMFSRDRSDETDPDTTHETLDATGTADTEETTPKITLSRAERKRKKIINKHLSPRPSSDTLAHNDEDFDEHDSARFAVKRYKDGHRVGLQHKGPRTKRHAMRRIDKLARLDNEKLPEDQQLSEREMRRQIRGSKRRFLAAKWTPRAVAVRQVDHGGVHKVVETIITATNRETEVRRINGLREAPQTTRHHERTRPSVRATTELKKTIEQRIPMPKKSIFTRPSKIRKVKAERRAVTFEAEERIRTRTGHIITAEGLEPVATGSVEAPKAKYSSPELDAAKARGDLVGYRKIIHDLVEAGGGTTNRMLLRDRGIDLDQRDANIQAELDRRAKEAQEKEEVRRKKREQAASGS